MNRYKNVKHSTCPLYFSDTFPPQSKHFRAVTQPLATWNSKEGGRGRENEWKFIQAMEPVVSRKQDLAKKKSHYWLKFLKIKSILSIHPRLPPSQQLTRERAKGNGEEVSQEKKNTSSPPAASFFVSPGINTAEVTLALQRMEICLCCN